MTTAAFLAARSHWKPHASALFDQLQRAALSVQCNIAEGYALGSHLSPVQVILERRLQHCHPNSEFRIADPSYA